MVLPEGGLLDRKYHRQSAEQVYRTLSNDDEALDDALEQLESNSDDDDSDSDSDSQNGGGDSDSDSDADADDSDSQSGDSDATGNGQGKSLEEKLADVKLPSGEVWMPTNENGQELSPTEMAELQEELQRTISMADKLDTIGENPTGGFGKAMEQLNESYVDW